MQAFRKGDLRSTVCITFAPLTDARDSVSKPSSEYFVSTNLDWLPERSDWSSLLAATKCEAGSKLDSFRKLAQNRVDFISANRLDKALQRHLADLEGAAPTLPRVRLAVLGSSMISHLLPHIRLGAFRRGLLVEVYEGPFGMYRQELAEQTGALHSFAPDVVLFALDAEHLVGPENRDPDVILNGLSQLWETAKVLGATVIQQTLMPRFSTLLGNNECRVPRSAATCIDKINWELRERARTGQVHLLALDDLVRTHGGVSAWFDANLWFLSKQEVAHAAAPLYGDHVGRLLSAIRGLSSKCLVLDLDNTLWGGVIGDDGLDGIVLGQGTPAGEAFVSIQRYAKRLSQRGIILAVCSKNDETNAVVPFREHAEMVLRKDDIACFVANWQDKATNLRHIASALNIGLDSLVFVDDNPAERDLIRRELPMVCVPELPDDPAGYVEALAKAGYFEALELTPEDEARAQFYRDDSLRQSMHNTATDMESFLNALSMELTWLPFNSSGLKRIVQLINKTNQFNLTTLRLTEENVQEIMTLEEEGRYITLQLRLGDVYGDNGIVSLVIGKIEGKTIHLLNWLMSCRVLGRGIEHAALNILAEQARQRGCNSLRGAFIPTQKNSMVKDHYQKLGFTKLDLSTDEETVWSLDVSDFEPQKIHMKVNEGTSCRTIISTVS